MDSHTLNIDIPSDLLIVVNESEQELKARIKLLLATQLFKLQKVTIGKASEIAGLSRLEFETYLSSKRISISALNIQDVESDLQKIF